MEAYLVSHLIQYGYRVITATLFWQKQKLYQSFSYSKNLFDMAIQAVNMSLINDQLNRVPLCFDDIL